MEFIVPQSRFSVVGGAPSKNGNPGNVCLSCGTFTGLHFATCFARYARPLFSCTTRATSRTISPMRLYETSVTPPTCGVKYARSCRTSGCVGFTGSSHATSDATYANFFFSVVSPSSARRIASGWNKPPRATFTSTHPSRVAFKKASSTIPTFSLVCVHARITTCAFSKPARKLSCFVFSFVAPSESSSEVTPTTCFPANARSISSAPEPMSGDAHVVRFAALTEHPNGASIAATVFPTDPQPIIRTFLSDSVAPMGEPSVLEKYTEERIAHTSRIAARVRNTAISAVLAALPVCSLGMRAKTTPFATQAASSTPSSPTPN
mmetsp:Transcript_11182/g.46951  ORF Transcript_11182/g.46951 Transcript_11182/m.46951 type:complete len:321 (+) Transcript_11182:2250-3212(+)